MHIFYSTTLYVNIMDCLFTIIISNHCMKHSSRTVQIVVVQLLLRHVILL